MLEITPDDIALLSDEQLRAVVARLCEAELRKRGYSAAYVTSGGNQNAADGGIDVRVALPLGLVTDGFVPRRATGFQVKQQDMPAGETKDEMRPKGVIRPSIQDLADQSGAYIIVSSQGSTADTALTSRRDAMKESVVGVRNADALLLDFYDRTRVATWLRSHEGLIPWVRTLIGRAIPGWQSYGSWCAPDAVTAEYLFDERLRIYPVGRETHQGLSALKGIEQIRDELREARHVVRLVGLSGVGKTRLVQALFDERVGEHSLDPSLACYTNMAEGPDPQPISIASDLVAAGTRAILVIDNCPPELHQRLSEVCRQSGSNVSVITVEYDIREDEPEGTEVFKLESSSRELIEKLVRRRFPDISQIDARAIAEFSGGNARIAIALAATVGRNETVAGLTDEQLFQRLFLQRHAHDESLYLAAQACALVYSFQGEDVSESGQGELVHLGRLIGKTPQELYRRVAELQRRDLVQQRSVWRAVLPHAIANRLAATALQNVPYAEIERHLMTGSSARLLQSLSRRLGYLHASTEAVAIVRRWLGVGGLLEKAAEFNDLSRAMFENVAPAAPEDALAALERVLLGPQQGEATAKECKKYCDLLRSLAYDAALFERCIALLVIIVTAEDVTAQGHGTQILISLFHLILSGTLATIEQRVAVIGSLLASPDEKRRALGVLALKGVLEALHFGSVGSFDFGAQSRDFGYWPRTRDDVQHWFGVSLKLVESVACGDGPSASQARAVFAEKFRGLWLRGGNPDEIARVCQAIRDIRFWKEGWLAVRQTLDLDGKGIDDERRVKLVALETALRPADLLQNTRAVVFSISLLGVDLDDFEDHSGEDITARRARTEALAQDLGRAVASDQAAFAELLPEIVASDGRLWFFGQGLAAGAADAAEMWNRLVAALALTEESSRRPQVLLGFLRQVRATNPALATGLLDEAVEHETLAGLYPFLQVAVDLEASDIVRLKRSVALGKAPAGMYRHLAYGRASDPIRGPDLQELVVAIAAMPSGYDVAIEILHMRLLSEKDRTEEIAPELIDTGCQLLEQFTFTKKKNDREDYQVCDLTQSCLKGERGATVTIGICQRLKSAVARHETSAFYHDDLMAGLISAQPLAALDGLCGGDQKELELGVRILVDIDSRKHPLALVSDEDLLNWCDREAQTRYPAMARVIVISERTGENLPPRWTNIALRFLEKAPDPSAILSQFTLHFMPSGGWSGSLASILESNATLLDQLGAYPELSEVVAEQKEQMRKWIEEERRRETALDRQRDERFE